MPDKHLSTQFDSELNAISSRVMVLGGLIESQVQRSITALSYFNSDAASEVIVTETQVNEMEVAIDHEISSIIARRQPAANDLRSLIAMSKATANLERAGDEADKMARMVLSIVQSGKSRLLPAAELGTASELAAGLLRKSLDAFARLDTTVALNILKEDNLIDKEFEKIMRLLITYMMEDPRMISPSLDLLFLAKSIERVGDHAKNIAELIIYVVKGADVRHLPIEQIEVLLI
jgi:phosphate transport system protein